MANNDHYWIYIHSDNLVVYCLSIFVQMWLTAVHSRRVDARRGYSCCCYMVAPRQQLSFMWDWLREIDHINPNHSGKPLLST